MRRKSTEQSKLSLSLPGNSYQSAILSSRNLPGSSSEHLQTTALAPLPTTILYSTSSYLPMAEYSQRSHGTRPPPADQGEQQYQPKDAVGQTIKATALTSGAGLFVSTIQNTLTRQNVGAFGVFTRTGGTIAVFGMLRVEEVWLECIN